MIDFFREWIMSVVTTVLFITIVELILPDNPIKKYVKIGTGLLIMIVVLTPIFKVIHNDFNVGDMMDKYTASLNNYEKVDSEKAKKQFDKKTIEAFSVSFKTNIKQQIKSQTGKDYEVVSISLKNTNMGSGYEGVKNITLRKTQGEMAVSTVEEVVIGKEKKVVAESDPDVLRVLKNDFNISASEVKFIK
ncbi:stage III sporulation protein AF [Clostridium sp.]|uniref:stage III sporulation protein AF n=1 Tax=Clostridium sp. TaxID=1506 RepID=UPI002FCC762A